MEQRTLGRTGQKVSVLGFGAMELRGTEHHNPRPIDRAAAERLLHRVLDQGLNLIDTSIDYGASEETIGAALGSRRSEFFLASKCGCPVGWSPGMPHGRGAHDFSPHNVRNGVHQSLARLRTDHLDLVQLHMSPTREVLARHDTVAEMVRLRDEGKVRFLGSSSTLPDLMDLVQMDVFDAFQVPYSALQREHELAIAAAAHVGAGIIVRGGVARGAVTRADPADSQWQQWEAARLDELTQGMSRSEFMLRFTLSHPDVGTVIVGTANERHLADNVVAAGHGVLPPDVYEEAKRRLDSVGQRSGT